MEVVYIIFFWEAWGWLVINKQFFSVELRYITYKMLLGMLVFKYRCLAFEGQVRLSRVNMYWGPVIREESFGHFEADGQVTHLQSTLVYEYETGHFILHIKSFFVPAWLPVSMKDLVWVILLQANMKMLLVGITALEFPIRG